MAGLESQLNLLVPLFFLLWSGGAVDGRSFARMQASQQW
jgi:hypothetical protein|tara:strand:- start:133 stop:249 length:117 start_codon:yes stop_codon:yes gene_type:complete